MWSSVICRYHTQSLVVTKNTLQNHISEPSKTCFSRFSKMKSLYLDVQIYPYFNKGQTLDNNYTLRQTYEQTMNKECVYLYLNQLTIFDKGIFYLLSPESITNKIKFNFQNKYESYPCMFHVSISILFCQFETPNAIVRYSYNATSVPRTGGNV